MAALVGVLVAYELGDDVGGAEESGSAIAGPREPGDPGPGCTGTGRSDPDVIRADRIVARCAPGAPAPDPLDRTRRLRVAVGAGSEAGRAVVVAEEQGELAAEGLDVELETMPVAEGYEALAAGDVDVVVGRLDAGFFDGVHAGSGARQVMGGTIPREPGNLDVPQEGLWLQTGLLRDVEHWRPLEGHRLVVPGGIGGAVTYPVGAVLDQGGLSLNVVDIRPLRDRADDALLAGTASGAWVPRAQVGRLVVAGSFELMATLPPSEPLDGTVVSADLLDEDRDVGLAFVRAIIRTVNTYLSGDGAAELDGDGSRFPPPMYDWEIRTGTAERVQEGLIDVGGVTYEEALPEDELVDRSLVAAVIRKASRR
ncbi:MAG: ABC transporter substrate-binding protein [Acidimicrobiia bacterium]